MRIGLKSNKLQVTFKRNKTNHDCGYWSVCTANKRTNCPCKIADKKFDYYYYKHLKSISKQSKINKE